MSGTLTNPLTGLPIDDTDLESLASLVQEQSDLEELIANAEAGLKQLKADLLRVSTQRIPEKMDAIGLASVTLKNGRKVTVTPFYNCKIKSNDAFKWLDENGHGGIIKTEVFKSFMRNEREQAIAWQQEHPDFGFKESVHHMTLTSFTKEIYSDGGTLPPEHFEVFQGAKAKIA